jgi:hypothetical protein
VRKKMEITENKGFGKIKENVESLKKEFCI